jgi:O-antigen/teichoic acid export membrane protein
LLLVFNAMSNVQNGLLAGLEAFRDTAKINLLRGILFFTLSIAGAYFYGLPGVVLGLGLGMMFSYFFGLFLMIKQAHRLGIRCQLPASWKEVTSVASFSATTICSALVFISAEWIAVAILVRQPEGFGEMGYYNVANQWINFIAFIPLMLANPSLSLMANMYGEGKFEQYRKVFWGNIKIVGGFTAVIALVVGILAPYIMAMYGAKYVTGAIVLQILCVMVTLRSVIRVTSQSLLSMGWVRAELGFGAIWAVFFLGFWLMLTSRGAAGMVSARTAGNVIFLILQGSFVLYLIKRLK